MAFSPTAQPEVDTVARTYSSDEPVDDASDQVQTLTIDATGGTFTLSFDGKVTSAIAEDANAATIQAALEALSNINSGDVTVAGTGPFTITFEDTGAYGRSRPPTLVPDYSSLTGGGATATVAVTTEQYSVQIPDEADGTLTDASSVWSEDSPLDTLTP